MKKKTQLIKDVRNFFRLKKEENDTAIKDIRNLFRLKKKLKELKIYFLDAVICKSMKKAENKIKFFIDQQE